MNRCQSKYFRRKKSWRQLHFLLIKIFKSLHVPNAINDHQFNKWFEHSSKNTFMDRLVRSVETTSHIKICQTIILKHSLNCTKCFKIFIHKCVFKCHMKTSHKKCAKDFFPQIFTYSIILISLLGRFSETSLTNLILKIADWHNYIQNKLR